MEMRWFLPFFVAQRALTNFAETASARGSCFIQQQHTNRWWLWSRVWGRDSAARKDIFMLFFYSDDCLSVVESGYIFLKKAELILKRNKSHDRKEPNHFCLKAGSVYGKRYFFSLPPPLWQTCWIHTYLKVFKFTTFMWLSEIMYFKMKK